jgi:tetratricopeptide (TPR) repeat protein
MGAHRSRIRALLRGGIVLTGFFLLAGSVPATAESAQALTKAYMLCIFPNMNRMDAVIRNCSLIINSGRGEADSIADAYLSRGNMYRHKAQYDRALSDYNAALKLNPDSAATFTSRGNAWRGKKELGRALADHSEAIRLNPKYSTAYNNRGNVWRDKHEFERAIADYDQAIAFNDHYAMAYYNRANTRLDAGDKDSAVADYKRALELDPTLTEAADALKEFADTR